MRNLQDDLAMCEKATKGPWKILTVDDDEKSYIVRGSDGTYAGIKLLGMSIEDVNYIVLSREALPYYINKTVELEEAYDVAKAAVEFFEGEVKELRDKSIAQQEEIRRLKDLIRRNQEVYLAKSVVLGGESSCTPTQE